MKNFNLIIVDESTNGEIFEIDRLGTDSLKVYTDDECSFENNLKDKEKFLNDMNFDLEIQMSLANFEENYSHYDDSKRVWNYFNDNIDNIYDSVDYIFLNIEEDCLEFINKHSILCDKKIVIPYCINITDFETVDTLTKKFEEYSNIYVTLQGNTDYVNLNDCYKIMNEIKIRSNHVKSLNLSPLESVMYAYDLVRDRVYIKEENDDWMESRDLKNILFGKAIVCVGYSRILSCILDNLGIYNELVHLDSKVGGNGHLRNAIYIDDSKYNINGYYYLDATWDSKKKDNDYYLFSYLYFLKTEEEIGKLENHRFERFGGLLNVDEFCDEIDKIFEKSKSEDFFSFVHLANVINLLYRRAFHSNERLINYDFSNLNFSDKFDKEEMKKNIHLINEKLNNSIPAETYIQLVNNVRKIENYIDPEKYPYSLDVLYCIYKNSEWVFKEKHYNPHDLLLARIFGESVESTHNPKKDFVNFIHFDSKIIDDLNMNKDIKNLIKNYKND